MYEKGTIQEKTSASFYPKNKGVEKTLSRSTKGVIIKKNVKLIWFNTHFENAIY